MLRIKHFFKIVAFVLFYREKNQHLILIDGTKSLKSVS